MCLGPGRCHFVESTVQHTKSLLSMLQILFRDLINVSSFNVAVLNDDFCIWRVDVIRSHHDRLMLHLCKDLIGCHCGGLI